MSLVRDAVQALDGPPRRQALGASAALICSLGLLSGCGGSHAAKQPTGQAAGPDAAASVRTANCAVWRSSNVESRRTIVAHLREFARGPIGSSSGMQHGRALDDRRAYRLFQSYCANDFARGFKLYKLYERAAAFAGH